MKLLTGDAGGGAAVQNLHPALIRINVMGLSSRSVRCLMHALNKAFEVACLDCFGSHGINHRRVTQMYWLVVQMFMRIKLQGGLKLIDEYYNLALSKLRMRGKPKETPSFVLQSINSSHLSNESLMKQKMMDLILRRSSQHMLLVTSHNLLCQDGKRSVCYCKDLSCTLSRHLFHGHCCYPRGGIKLLFVHYCQGARLIDDCAAKQVHRRDEQ